MYARKRLKSPLSHTLIHSDALSFSLCLLVCTLGYRSVPQILIHFRISGAHYCVSRSLLLSLFYIHLKYFDAFVLVLCMYVRLGRQEKHHNMTTAVTLNVTHFYYPNKMMRTSYISLCNFLQHFSGRWTFLFSVLLRNQSERNKTSKNGSQTTFSRRKLFSFLLFPLDVFAATAGAGVSHFNIPFSWHRRKPIICSTFKVNIRLSNSHRKLMFFSCVFHRSASSSSSISSCLKFMACFCRLFCCVARTLFLDPRQLMH